MRAAYVATKFALEGYTDVLRLELRDTPIRVMLMEPGPVKTLIRVNARPHYERWIDRDNSAWAQFYRDTLEPRLYKERPPPDPFELSCEATSRKVVHAFESPRPRPRPRLRGAAEAALGLGLGGRGAQRGALAVRADLAHDPLQPRL